MSGKTEHAALFFGMGEGAGLGDRVSRLLVQTREN